jgi:hypothetical protein
MDGGVAVSRDPFGPLCVLSRKNACLVLNTRTNTVIGRFTPHDTASDDQVFVDSASGEWFGVGLFTGDLQCVSLAPPFPTRWRRRFRSHAEDRASFVLGGTTGDELAVLLEDGTLHTVARSNGATLRVRHDIARMWTLDAEGSLCLATRSDDLLVCNIGTEIQLRRTRQDVGRSVLSACRADDVVAISWTRGGISLFDRKTGAFVGHFASETWVNRLTWHNASRRLLGSGSIGQIRDSIPLWIDPIRETTTPAAVQWPDQREFACCFPCDRGTACITDNGYLWHVDTDRIESISELPL